MLLHKHHGKTLANTIFNSVKSEYLLNRGLFRDKRPPCLKIYLLDENPASVTFIKQKIKLGENLNFDIRFQHLKSYTDEIVSNLICADNNDDSIDGITIQLPVNGQKSIPPIDLIAPDKDIDGIGRVNRDLLKDCNSEAWPHFVSPAAVGILSILKSLTTFVFDKRIVIIGNGVTVGWPLCNYLKRLGAENVVNLVKTASKQEQSEICAEADVIVIGCGLPYHVDDSFLSRTKRQIIVDCGCHINVDDKIKAVPCIKVAEKSVGNLEHVLVPNINGIGPLTVVSLFKNLLKAYSIHQKK